MHRWMDRQMEASGSPFWESGPSLMSYPACPRTPIVYWADPIGSDIQIRLSLFFLFFSFSFFFFLDIVIVTHILVQLLDAG